ncbi:MAG TPA: zinc ribbon domain-containing protein [Candidatus Dormibacteraeota bacterium]
MALTCARCGAQNPDGNQFCQACGTPLSRPPAGAPPPPPSALPLAYASPPPTPVAYASPYYSPAGAAPQGAVHRTPWVLIIGAVVVLILVMAGCGTAIALLHGGGITVTGGISGLPSPTPGTSPSPIASPTSSTNGATTTSTPTVSVPIPAGWSVASQDAESIILVNQSATGSVTVASGTSSPAMTAQQNKDDVEKGLRSKYPDTAPCPGSKTTTGNLNGAAGIFWSLCFTLTTSGRSFPAVASLFVGANSAGNVYYLVMLATSQSNLQSFTAESKPVVQGIQWKLK